MFNQLLKRQGCYLPVLLTPQLVTRKQTLTLARGFPKLQTGDIQCTEVIVSITLLKLLKRCETLLNVTVGTLWVAPLKCPF